METVMIKAGLDVRAITIYLAAALLNKFPSWIRCRS